MPASATKKALLILGGSGLVGQQAIEQALARPDVERVVAPTRRPLPPRARLDNPIVDYDALPADALWWRADAVVCALGTTMRQAGSQAAFRMVDHDYVLAAARLARAAGSPSFALNSSLGARPDGGSFYLRVKGETERDLAALGFASLTWVRPSLLDGGPRPDKRPGERAALCVMHLLGPLVPMRYRAVRTTDVARALLDGALAAMPGLHIIESDRLHGCASPTSLSRVG